MRNSITKIIEFTIHLLIWGGLFILLILEAKNLGVFKKEDGSIYIPLVYGLLTNLVLFYTNAYFIIPKYLPAKK